MLRHMVHNWCYYTSAQLRAILDVVKFLLLQPGTNINARDTNDVTPLVVWRLADLLVGAVFYAFKNYQRRPALLSPEGYQQLLFVE
ncbi:hypothetical protein OS493_027838 [Desmophyllum pertusum]|uniref:Uncharacterized protein n=1 Tax=Desmophyllum pertusum TaxID=174260 RepID=A0A9W9YYM5_9CNID|nr:hypothetical protein OS493_027838 [Desmophyllum pertusum]